MSAQLPASTLITADLACIRGVTAQGFSGWLAAAGVAVVAFHAQLAQGGELHECAGADGEQQARLGQGGGGRAAIL